MRLGFTQGLVAALVWASMLAHAVSPVPRQAIDDSAATRMPAERRPVGQAPARDTKPKEPLGTGVVRGRVVGADTGAPLRHAYVVLMPTFAGARSSETLTDLEGRFEFTRLPPGRYRVSGAKRSYLTLEYGQRRPREAGRPVDVADAQTIEKIDLVLPRAGVIAGTVVDDLGDTVDGLMVMVLQRQFVQGERRLVPVSPVGASVNDLGQYRIPDLPPGTYYVGAIPLRAEAGEDDAVSFAPTYYPGTPDMAGASPIVLEVGKQRLSVDFPLAGARPARVAGVVLDSLGQKARNASVRSWQSVGELSMSTTFEGARAATRADGTFTLERMRPGPHALAVDATNALTGEREHGEMSINVMGVDRDGVTLATEAPVRASGHVAVDPGATGRFPAAKVSVMISSGRGMLTASADAGAPDWTFELPRVPPGPLRRFGVTGLPADWTIGTVRYQGRDISDTGTDIAPNQPLTGVEILLTNRATEVSGTVTDGDGRPVVDYTVVVFSEDSTRWVAGRSVATAHPDQHGRFVVRHLRPGKYFAVALDYLAQGDKYDPEILGALRASATRLTLGDGEKKTIDIRLPKGDR